jgi:hypothetical protein
VGRRCDGQELARPRKKGKNMKTLLIAFLAGLVTTASAQELTAPIGPQKPVRAMPTPPPVAVRPAVQGVVPRAFGPGRNPLQMLNPWAPARYGTWVESTSFDPNIPGKWNGIKFFEILF